MSIHTIVSFETADKSRNTDLSANKSRNIYMLQQEEYTKLLMKTSPKPTRNQVVKNYSSLTVLQKRSQKNCLSLIG